jgi:hypothetical protein
MASTGKKILLALGAVAAVMAITLLVLVQSANRILKSELEHRLGKDFSVGSLDLSWGSLQARDVRLSRQGEVLASAKAVALKADFLGFLKDRITISSVSLGKPFLRLEVDRSGKLILPEVPAAGGSGASGSGPGKRIDFKRIDAARGEILYLDGKISSPPYPTRLTDIECTLSDIAVPPDNAWTDCSLSARVPGKSSTGTLTWKGKTNFLTKDTEGTLMLKDLDILTMKPYYHTKGDIEVSKGTLSVNMEVRIKDRAIRAPGRAVIRDLDFASGRGVGDIFMGVPRSSVLDLLKSGKNEIVLDFTVEGSLDDPRFNLRESLMKRLGLGLAQRLGLSVLGGGQPAVTEGLRGLKEVSKGLEKLLGR